MSINLIQGHYLSDEAYSTLLSRMQSTGIYNVEDCISDMFDCDISLRYKHNPAPLNDTQPNIDIIDCFYVNSHPDAETDPFLEDFYMYDYSSEYYQTSECPF